MSAGAQGAAPWTLGDFRVWDHQPKGRSGWERKQPKNKPTRAEEGNRWRLGELFRAAAWGQRPHTVDTSVPLPLWNKAQDSCPDAGPLPAWGSRPAHHPAEPWPGYLAPGRKMNPEQDCAQRAAAAAPGDVLPGSREKRPRGRLTTLPNPALPAGMNRAGPDAKTQQNGGGAHST